MIRSHKDGFSSVQISIVYTYQNVDKVKNDLINKPKSESLERGYIKLSDGIRRIDSNIIAPWRISNKFGLCFF